jgi:hypothetical protein
VFIQIAKLFTLPTRILSALVKYLEGDTSKLNEIIEEIMIVVNFMVNVITNTVSWIVSNFLNFYENFITPLGSFNITIPIDGFPTINIPLPANKKYRELDENSWWRTFDASMIINFITKILSSTISIIFGWINDLLEILDPIINLDLSKIEEMVSKLITWFAELFAPVLKFVNVFIEKLIGLFLIAVGKIEEVVEYIIDKIIQFLNGLDVDESDIPAWILPIYRLVKCLLLLILNIFNGILNVVGITS